MNHLMRDRAPITATAWSQIEEEATRTLRHELAGRRLVDVSGPHGWAHTAVDLGRVVALSGGPVDGVEAALRRVLPLVELRTPFTLARPELDAAERGADDLDLAPVVDAARRAARAEDRAVFDGFDEAGLAGVASRSPHQPVAVTDDFADYPAHVAAAVAILQAADVAGPYALALGPSDYTGVTESTERGYPVLEHLRTILGGPVVRAPVVEGAFVLSQRGGDFQLVVGEDFSIGYRTHDADSVSLYLEESIAFRVNAPEAAVRMTRG